jgi:hypothetical protein
VRECVRCSATGRTYQRTVYPPAEICQFDLFCNPADPEAKGVVECLQGCLETNFGPGLLKCSCSFSLADRG